MMKHNKSVLMLGGAVTALLAFSAVSSASAFDRVHWSWYQKVHEHVDIDIDIDPAVFDPTGIVDLEKLQVFIGDVKAVSVVKDVNNYQPSEGTNGTVDFTVNWSGPYGPDIDPEYLDDTVAATLSGDLSGNGDVTGSTVSEGTNQVNFTAAFTDVPVTVEALDSFDALTELPSVNSTATAVGNNQNISTDVAVTLHDGQFLFGGFNCNFEGDGITGVPYTGNSNLSGALALIYAGSDGLINSSEIEAKSIVENITNAAVESAATAVGNNISVDIAYDPATDNGLLIGDITQVAYADVSAKSIVKYVDLNNYTNLGTFGSIVNSTATAVGNNASITVKAAVPPVTP
ncbi:MAG: hypothetical protein WBG82_12980 [Parvibaculum sp.]|uniref:hypothetical protein n=1 Tax=Parvibaculum sp. TaxID=2024848 RepID=UPI003C753E2A